MYRFDLYINGCFLSSFCSKPVALELAKAFLAYRPGSYSIVEVKP